MSAALAGQDTVIGQPHELPAVSNLATSLQANIQNVKDTRLHTSQHGDDHPHHQRDTTFYKSASILINEPIGSMSLSPANRDVVLAARKGLYIVDLESPFAPPRFLAQLSTWEAADVQWSPHPARAHWVASTSNNRLLIWNLDRPEGAPRGQLITSDRDSALHSGAASTRLGAGTYTTASTSPTEGASLKSQSFNPLRQSLSGPSTASSPRSSAIEYSLSAHTRAITDINFSAHHPDILASCAIDAWSWVWDLRTPTKPVQGYSAWNAPANQVKWNRSSPHRLATAVDNKVLIWDDRKGALPLATIDGHLNQIYGLDWSRATSSRGLDCLVTCSLDGAVKFWDLGTPASQAAIGTRSLITEAEQIIQTSTPIWRARHLPFGDGVMTLPQRGDTSLSMWSKEHPEEGPVERFVGHKDIVKEYLFRTRGGSDLACDDRRFQLITWSKDQTLRLWPVSEEAMKKVGHQSGGKIQVLQTRQNARDISYRDAPYSTPAQVIESNRRPSIVHQHPSTDTSAAASPHLAAGLLDGSAHALAVNSSLPSVKSGLLGSSLSDRAGVAGPFSQTAASPSSHLVLSRSFPKSVTRGQLGASFADKGASHGSFRTAGGAASIKSHETRPSGVAVVTSTSTFTAPPHALAGGRYASLLASRAEPTAAATTAQHPKDPATAARRAKRRSKRLAQGAATTYMTRGSGAALGADLLRMKVGALYYSHNSRSRNEAVSWISGVKVDKNDQRSKRRSKSEEMGRSASGGDLALLKRPGVMTRGVSDGVTRRPLVRQDSERDNVGELDLQEEIIDLSKEFSQVSYEKVDIAKRVCILGLYGPWAGKGGPVYMRLSLRFPQAYPAEAPKIDVDHNAFVSLKTRAFLLRALRAIIAECVDQREGCMKPCARFLAGSRTIEVGHHVVLAPQSAPIGEDSDEDEATVSEKGAKVPGQMIRLLPGARCGASFSPSGHLVAFNVVKTPTHSRAQSRLRNMIAWIPEPPLIAGGEELVAGTVAPFSTESVASISATGTSAHPTGGRFLSSYVAITSAMDSLMRLANDPSDGDQIRTRSSRVAAAVAARTAQGPELMHLMDANFLARRLQARSDSRRTGQQGRARDATHGQTNRQLQSSTELSDSPQRGRQGPTIERSSDASNVFPPTTHTPRSRSVAIGKDRQNAFPLVASSRLVHVHSEVKIYKVDVSALTLRISSQGQPRAQAGEDGHNLKASEGRGEGRRSHVEEAGSRSRADALARPVMGRKRSASSPSAPMRALQ